MLPQPQHRAVLRRGLFEIPLHELEVCLHQPCVLHHVAPGIFFHIFAVIVVVGHLCTMVFGGDVGNV